MSDESPDELDAIRAGDAEAFGRWLGPREPRLRASLRSFARAVDTEAVVQETLLRVWLLAPKVTDDGKPEVLLRLAIRIARNHAIDVSRRAGRESTLTPEIGETLSAAPVAASDPILRAKILECLAALPGQPRRALETRLQDAGRLRDAVLAASASMNLNTFLKNVGRARRLLAECLARAGVDLMSELR